MTTGNLYEAVPSDERNVRPDEHHDDYLRRMVEGSRHDAWNEGDANGDERGYARAKAERAEIVSGLLEALVDCAGDSMAAGLGTGNAGATSRWNAAVSAIAKATGE